MAAPNIKLLVYQKNREKVVAPPEPREKVSTGVHGQPSVRLIDQYYGLLIQVFARVGLLEVSPLIFNTI